LIVDYFGWQVAMILIGAILLLLSLLIGLIVRDDPGHFLERTESLLPKTRYSLLKGLWVVLCNPQTWINGAIVGLLYAPTAAFAELWGVSYLKRTYALSNGVAGAAVSMIFVGWAVGGPWIGHLSDRLKRRKPLIVISALCSTILLLCVLYIPGKPVWLIFTLLFFYGISNVGVGICYAVAAEINRRPLAGTSMSFANMASVIIGASLQPIMGWLLDKLWNGEIENGVRFYSAANFHEVFIILPICLMMSAVMCFFLKESFGLQEIKKR
jgi:MFS family permease